MFKNGLDADVEALRENTEREWLGGEGMVDGERVGLSVNHLLGHWLSRLRLTATGREGGTRECHTRV